VSRFSSVIYHIIAFESEFVKPTPAAEAYKRIAFEEAEHAEAG
jgi:hypothetical protein